MLRSTVAVLRDGASRLLRMRQLCVSKHARRLGGVPAKAGIKRGHDKENGMTGADTLDFARESIYLLLELAAPAMLTALVVGVVIGLLQALTQIQEMTLVFVPKILAIFLVLLIALPFAGEAMATYMENVAARIAQP